MAIPTVGPFAGVRRAVVRGIGSLTNHGHDAQAIVQKAVMELVVQAPALEFVNSSGWKLVQKQYRGLIREMKLRIIFLTTNTEGNKAEIQHTSDLIGACEMMMDLTDKVIQAHQEAQETITKNAGTAGGQ